MPEGMVAELGRPAERRKFRSLDRFILITLLLILAALVYGFGLFQQVKTEQGASEQRGYKNRAVICDMTAALGLHENPECSDPQVAHYRDQTAATTGTTGARNSKTTLLAVCRVADALKVFVPECAGLG
jgi:hypothetical protein